jgi:hypothetical protein
MTRLPGHRKPPQLRRPRPCRRNRSLAPAATGPGKRPPARLYSPRPFGASQHLAAAPISPGAAQSRRRRGQAGDGGVPPGVRPAGGGAAVFGPRLQFGPGLVPPGRMTAAPLFRPCRRREREGHETWPGRFPVPSSLTIQKLCHACGSQAARMAERQPTAGVMP